MIQREMGQLEYNGGVTSTLPATLFKAAGVMGPAGFLIAMLSAAFGGMGICGPTTTIGAVVLIGGMSLLGLGFLTLIAAGLAKLLTVCFAKSEGSVDRT